MFFESEHSLSENEFKLWKCNRISFPIHIHRSFEYFKQINGSTEIWIDDRKYILKSGESVLVFPEQLHSLSSEKSEHFLVIFSPDIVSAYYSGHSGEYPQSNRLSLPHHLLSQITTLKKDSSSIMLKAIFYSVCAEFDENATYVKGKTAKKGLLKQIFDFVENNFEKSCTLEDLSAAIGHNSAYLSRYFSESTNMTFLSLVNRYRISRACYILKNSNRSVTECAYECGYKSLRSFNRNFISYIGMSPRDYRKNQKKDK